MSDEMTISGKEFAERMAYTARLEARVARLREALAEIANTDYRGNRSTESHIAYRALEADHD